MSPPKRKRILRANKIYKTLQQKTRRKEILRKKMLQVATHTNIKQVPDHTFTSKSSSAVGVKTELKTNAPSNAKTSMSPILLRTRNTIEKPFNLKISFNTTSNGNEKRKIQAFELSRVATQVLKVKPDNSIRIGKKQWPKLVCSMEIVPLTSHDSMLHGAALSRNIDFTSSPPSSPIPPSPKIPIIPPAPSTSLRALSNSPTLNYSLINSASPTKKIAISQASFSTQLSLPPTSQSSVSQQEVAGPKKRRLVLSDSLPPMFKAPFKVPLLIKAPCKAPFRSPIDLRQRISGNLRKFEDDSVSICGYSEIITDEDANNVAVNPTSRVISSTKNAEIMNWVTQSESLRSSSGISTDLSNTPPFSSDSDSHSGTDKSDSPETILNLNSDESRTSYNRFDRFQVSFNSSAGNSAMNVQDHVNQSKPTTTISNPVIVKSSSVDTFPANNINEVATSPSINQPLISPPQEIISSSNNRIERSPSFDRTSSNTSKDSLSHEIRRYASLSNISNETSEQELTPASVSTTHTIPNSLTQPTENTSQFKRPIQNTVVASASNVNFQRFPLESTQGNPSRFKIDETRVNRNRGPSKETSPFNQNPQNFLGSSIEPTSANETQRDFQIPHQQIDRNMLYRLRPPPQYQNRGRRCNFIRNELFNEPRIRDPNQIGPSSQSASRLPKRGGTFIRMNSIKSQRPHALMNVSFNIVSFDPTIPPPNAKQQNDCQGLTSSQQERQEFLPPRPQLLPMNLKQIRAYLSATCVYYFTNGNCKFGRKCKFHHACPVELEKSMSALNVYDLKGIFQLLDDEKKHNLIPEFLDVFVQSYVHHKDKMALLKLLPSVLQINNYSCSSKVEKILKAMCQVNVPFKDAILKALNYVGASNRKLFDILFAIAIEHFTPTANIPGNLDWVTVEQLLEHAFHIDFGVFSDLCSKCLDIPPHVSRPIMTVLGQILVDDPCKVDVTMIVPRILAKLCCRMEMIGCGRIAAEVRRKWKVAAGGDSWQPGDVDERMGMDSTFASAGDFFDDHQLSTISSTISGPNNQTFNSAYLQIPNASTAARITTQSTARNAERTKNSCSPDSSSFAPSLKYDTMNRSSTPLSSRPPFSSANPPFLSPIRYLPYNHKDSTSRLSTYSRSTKSGRKSQEKARYEPENSLNLSIPILPTNRKIFYRQSSEYEAFNTKPNLAINSTSTISHHTSRLPFPPPSPIHSSFTRSIQVPLNQSINSTPPQSTTTSIPFTNNTLELEPDVMDLCTSITRAHFSNVAAFIAREREEAIEVICQLVHNGSVAVQVAFSFFDCLWDHLTETFVRYAELKGIILFILFNIYEFLLKENNRGDASYLLTDRFSNDQHAFLHFKTFLPSGQCSPMQKCHKAVKILLEEKMLESCFHWFKLEEYQKVMLTSDINNKDFTEEKDHLIQEFLQLSYRKLDVALNLVEHCMNNNLSAKIDFKKHYNLILIQMINNTDHKEKVIKLKDRLFNDEYVYLNSQTLRSYVVEFYSHFSLEELLHIYDIISRDKIYPKLTGDEHMIMLPNTLKENEISIILLNFLHRIVKNRIEVSSDVNIRFHANSTTVPTMHGTPNGAVIYPRNLLMYSTIKDAIKRLINVLKSSNCVQNTSKETQWRVCQNSGTVTLLRDHVKAMVQNYKGPQTVI